MPITKRRGAGRNRRPFESGFRLMGRAYTHNRPTQTTGRRKPLVDVVDVKERPMCPPSHESSPTRAVQISAHATLCLRHRVLRPHQPAEASVYPLDHELSSGHYGVHQGDQVVAIGSIFLESQEGSDDPKAWRIRGMATDPDRRGLGFGGQVLEALVEHARQRAGETVWCNGRTTVEGFYRRFGFEAQGNVFDLPDLGPHLVMVRRL